MKKATYVRMLIREEPLAAGADVLADAVDLLTEMADDSPGSAFAWLRRNEKVQLWISPVTLAEMLEGASEPRAVKGILHATHGRAFIGSTRKTLRFGKSVARADWARTTHGNARLPNRWTPQLWVTTPEPSSGWVPVILLTGIQ